MKVLNNCSKLKGTQFIVQEDFSKRGNSARKNLWNSAVDEKRKGARVKLMFNKIKINNTVYAWNDENNRRYVCSGPSTSEDA